MQVRYVSGCSSMCGHVFVSCVCACSGLYFHVCACFPACACVCSGVCVFKPMPPPHAASGHKLQSQTMLEALGFCVLFICLSSALVCCDDSPSPHLTPCHQTVAASVFAPLSRLNSARASHSVVCVNNAAGQGLSLPCPVECPN